MRFSYPTRPNSVAALYWIGISMRAATANAVSFSDRVTFFDIIAVKLTNCRYKNQPTNYIIKWKTTGLSFTSHTSNKLDITNIRGAIPENYQIYVQVSCRQIFSYLPKVHLQLQQVRLREDAHWSTKRLHLIYVSVLN